MLDGSSQGTSVMYQFRFTGDVVEGAEVSKVKAKLARAFKVDEADIEGLFNGELEFVRESLDKTTARSYRAIFKRVGALGEITKQEEQTLESAEPQTRDLSNVSAPVVSVTEPQNSRPTRQEPSSGESNPDMGVGSNAESSSVAPSPSENGAVNSYEPAKSLASQRGANPRRAGNPKPKKSAAEPWLRYGGLAVVGTMIADTELQNAQIITRAGLDLGYLPLVLAHIPLFIGCYLLALQKRLPMVARFLGLFSFAGLSLLLLLPEKGARGHKVSLKSIAVLVFSCGLFVYWFGGAVQTSVDLQSYTQRLTDLSQGRNEYPNSELQSDEELYLAEQAQMRTMILELIELAKSGSLRPNQETDITDQMMHGLAGYIAWRKYQTHLHRVKGKRLPISLMDDFQNQDELMFRGLLRSVTAQSAPRMHEMITTWLISPIDDAQIAKTHRMKSQMNMVFDAVRNAQFTQMLPPRGTSSDGWERPKKLDLSKVGFPNIEGSRLEVYENHIEYIFDTPMVGNKTLAIGFHSVPGKKTWNQKNPPPRIVYTTINNDFPAKYAASLVSVFMDYK